MSPFFLCVALSAGWRWRATRRRSSHRATGRNLEGSCLQLLHGVVVDGWLSALLVCRPKALQATPLQSLGETALLSGGYYGGAYQPSGARLPSVSASPLKSLKTVCPILAMKSAHQLHSRKPLAITVSSASSLDLTAADSVSST